MKRTLSSPTLNQQVLATDKQPIPSPAASENGRFCGLCGHRNGLEAEICLNCNSRLGLNCPNCQQSVPSSSNFCGQCGAQLAASQPEPPRKTARRLPTALVEKISAASVKKVSERREVTVLFLDVTNFTAASHTLESEDVYTFINEAMSALVEVVRKYGGTIDKFTGDGLMALFGAPVTHENDPERAVRAALEMQSALHPLQRHVKDVHGFDFNVRIGINTGWVIAGRVGNQFHTEYTVIGDTVNLASRLESSAEPGTILVSEETFQRVRRLFKFQTVPPLRVKGIPEAVQAYRPLDLLEQPKMVLSLPELQVAMVGRSQEFDRLQEAMVAVRHHYQRHVAFITGEAGIGKSRLVTEFRRSLVRSDVKVYRGGCGHYTHARPLSVVAQIIRDILDVPETAPVDYQYEALRSYLAQYDLATDDVLPYLMHVLGLEQATPQLQTRLDHLDATMLQRQTHTALRRLFLAEARLTPLALIVEDLHWIDTASKDFLEYFIQTTDEIPILLVMLAREAVRETTLAPLLAAAARLPGRLVDLPLVALSNSERRLLIDQLIKDSRADTSDLKRRIAARAEGNPFYIQEIIRMLIDQGGLSRSPVSGDWEVTPQLDQLLNQIPGTVKGLILARIDRLPESVRYTLQKAAVIGFSFPVSVLHLLSEMGPRTMGAHLDELESRRYVSPKPFRAEVGYTFRHALLQETVYTTLLKRDRRQLHYQVAQAIETSQAWLPEEKIELLAHHYAESKEPAQAIPYLMAAGENAFRRSAYEATVKHYRRVIQLLPQQPDTRSQDYFKARIGLGRALKFVGQLDEAGQILLGVLQLLWRTGDNGSLAGQWPLLVEGLHEIADVRQREGIYHEALNYLEAGLQIVGDSGAQDHTNLWHSLLDRMAWIRFRQGQLDEAWALARTATAGVDPAQVEDPVRLASLYNTLGGIAWQQGNLLEAVTFVEQSLDLHERAGYFWGRAIAYGNLGVLHDGLGRWPKAVDYYNRAYTLQETIGDKNHQVVNLINLGVVHTRMGQHEAAQGALETALAMAEAVGDTWGIALSYVNLAELSFIRLQLEQAQRQVDSALAIADEIGSPEIQVQARRLLALLLAQEGELQVSLTMTSEALQTAQAAQIFTEAANCQRALGILYIRNDEYRTAEMHLRSSADLAAQQDDPYRQGLALLELGRLYQIRTRLEPSSGDGWLTKTERVLEQAAEKFKTLGASHDLDLVYQAVNQMPTIARPSLA